MNVIRKFALIWGTITVALFPLVGTWATWYPWPPVPDVISNFQNAVWFTWIWLGLFPTIIFTAIWWYLNEIKEN